LTNLLYFSSSSSDEWTPNKTGNSSKICSKNRPIRKKVVSSKAEKPTKRRYRRKIKPSPDNNDSKDKSEGDADADSKDSDWTMYMRDKIFRISPKCLYISDSLNGFKYILYREKERTDIQEKERQNIEKREARSKKEADFFIRYDAVMGQLDKTSDPAKLMFRGIEVIQREGETFECSICGVSKSPTKTVTVLWASKRIREHIIVEHLSMLVVCIALGIKISS
jgi:hypothetical protein